MIKPSGMRKAGLAILCAGGFALFASTAGASPIQGSAIGAAAAVSSPVLDVAARRCVKWSKGKPKKCLQYGAAPKSGGGGGGKSAPMPQSY
jgi:hypothetical protein